MKIIIKESQLQNLHELFSMEDLKGRFNYIFNLDKKKHPGANDYDRYKAILAFQKWIDLLYKYTKKEVPFEGVNGMNVATVWADSWGQNFSRPELPPARLDFTLRLFPNVDENNPPKSQEKFNHEYSEFQKVFEEYSRGIGLETIRPIDNQKVKEIKIKFNFLDVELDKLKSEMNEEKDSKHVKCRNCNKKFTQTIHKGKRSTLECPHCGTHNMESNKGWGNSTEKLSKEFKFGNFEKAMEFVNKVAKIAEIQNHHPDVEIKFNKVRISITDHDKGSVSDKCHKFVKAVDGIKENSITTELQERCWKGYTQKGMKTMFGKRYPNCVKKTK